MTEPGDERRERPPERIVVPGSPPRDDAFDDMPAISDEQQVRDLGSASRSCVAILAALLILALLLCLFLSWALFIR